MPLVPKVQGNEVSSQLGECRRRFGDKAQDDRFEEMFNDLLSDDEPHSHAGNGVGVRRMRTLRRPSTATDTQHYTNVLVGWAFTEDILPLADLHLKNDDIITNPTTRWRRRGGSKVGSTTTGDLPSLYEHKTFNTKGAASLTSATLFSVAERPSSARAMVRWKKQFREGRTASVEPPTSRSASTQDDTARISEAPRAVSEPELADDVRTGIAITPLPPPLRSPQERAGSLAVARRELLGYRTVVQVPV
mmetsp:Transcript_20459/g.57906  ORF Transcript_20459/g.57906 Transcript_20459/m.57906 type:complete len:248 (-) Transcript_20459:195-938(-)